MTMVAYYLLCRAPTRISTTECSPCNDAPCDDGEEHCAADAIDVMEAAFRSLLVSIDPDPDREGIRKTPARAAKALRFLTSGYGKAEGAVGAAIFEVDGVASSVDKSCPSSSLVVVRDIVVHSLCEHHLLPFFGKVHIAYLPSATGVLGLSKLARIADAYARRLQMQERLTEQIAQAVMSEARAQGVAVVVECVHMCMSMRGVHQHASATTTQAMLGAFKGDAALRQEFFSHIASSRVQGRM